jgi:LuxR family transcriptional regulator, maltose regulon positive regulatory protein
MTGPQHRPEGSQAHVPRETSKSWFEPLESKLDVPRIRSGVVPRTALVKRLIASSVPLVVVAAPAGYGKTTLLAQWIAEDERPAAWLTLDEGDDDPSRLLSYLVFALERVGPVDSVFPVPPDPGPEFTAHVLPRLARTLQSSQRPFLLVLDEADHLESPEIVDLIGKLVGHIPTGSQIVLSGRAEPPMPLKRMMAGGAVKEIGVRELALSAAEGQDMLERAGVPMMAEDADNLVRRVEGWPVGLYLLALAMRNGTRSSAMRSREAGEESIIDYLREEVLAAMPSDRREFMVGTAVLDRLSGPLCDAVLQRTGSREVLEANSRANLFISPVDKEHQWYRRHPLWAQLLLSELRATSPSVEVEHHARASRWYEAAGDLDQAIEHACAARNFEHAAVMIARNTLPRAAMGQMATVRRWIEKVPPHQAARIPSLAAAAAQAYISSGNVEQVRHWLAVLERMPQVDRPLADGRTSTRSAIAMIRAQLCLGGLRTMQFDASIAYELESGPTPWHAISAFLAGAARYHLGDVEAGLALLTEARELAAVEMPPVHALALAELSLAALDRGDWEGARTLALQGELEAERRGLQQYATMEIVYAAAALTCAYFRQPVEARRNAAQAVRLMSPLSEIAPWLSAECRIALAHTYMLLGDVGSARFVTEEARGELAGLREAVVMRHRFDGIHTLVHSEEASSLPEALTTAEIRVLQYLPTHLTYREIGERLHLSRNTIKTQVISAYRKLGVVSRSEAVAAAQRAGLVERGDALDVGHVEQERMGA